MGSRSPAPGGERGGPLRAGSRGDVEPTRLIIHRAPDGSDDEPLIRPGGYVAMERAAKARVDTRHPAPFPCHSPLNGMISHPVMMPRFGRSLAHDEGVALIRDWIAAMPASR